MYCMRHISCDLLMSVLSCLSYIYISLSRRHQGGCLMSVSRPSHIYLTGLMSTKQLSVPCQHQTLSSATTEHRSTTQYTLLLSPSRTLSPYRSFLLLFAPSCSFLLVRSHPIFSPKAERLRMNTSEWRGDTETLERQISSPGYILSRQLIGQKSNLYSHVSVLDRAPSSVGNR